MEKKMKISFDKGLEARPAAMLVQIGLCGNRGEDGQCKKHYGNDELNLKSWRGAYGENGRRR